MGTGCRARTGRRLKSSLFLLILGMVSIGLGGTTRSQDSPSLKAVILYKQNQFWIPKEERDQEARNIHAAILRGVKGNMVRAGWFIGISTQETSLVYLENESGAGYSGMYWPLIKQELKAHGIHPKDLPEWCWKHRYELTEWGAGVFNGFCDKMGIQNAVKHWGPPDAQGDYLKQVKMRRFEYLRKVRRFERIGIKKQGVAK